MYSDIREYNYYDNGRLITRVSQVEEYLDKKFADIHVDVDLSEIEEKIDNSTNLINENISASVDNITEDISEASNDIKEAISESENNIKNSMTDSVTEIKDAIEAAKPCLCNLATKEDVCKAKCAIIKEIDEKFVDLNELVKNN